MIHTATIKKIDPIIEEEITFIVNGMEIVAFMIYCPISIEEGKRYKVIFDIEDLDSFSVKKSDTKEYAIKTVDDTFKRIIYGKIESLGVIDAGIIIESELLMDYEYILEYEHLIGEYVEIYVDRLTAEIIEPVN